MTQEYADICPHSRTKTIYWGWAWAWCQSALPACARTPDTAGSKKDAGIHSKITACVCTHRQKDSLSLCIPHSHLTLPQRQMTRPHTDTHKLIYQNTTGMTGTFNSCSASQTIRFHTEMISNSTISFMKLCDRFIEKHPTNLCIETSRMTQLVFINDLHERDSSPKNVLLSLASFHSLIFMHILEYRIKMLDGNGKMRINSKNVHKNLWAQLDKYLIPLKKKRANLLR